MSPKVNDQNVSIKNKTLSHIAQITFLKAQYNFPFEDKVTGVFVTLSLPELFLQTIATVLVALKQTFYFMK